ncbi:MAG: glycosyltransferase family 1 protein [Anaerolineales bacterium]
MTTHNMVINGRCFLRQMTGIERYTHEIVKRLKANRMLQPNFNVNQIAGNLWEQISLPKQIKKNELLWSPANAGPWMVKNQVVTLHDASVFDHPEWFKPAFVAWTQLSWKILSKQARAIITVSNFSCERLKLHLGIPEYKIHVIYNGVGKPFECQPSEKVSEVKRKYALEKPYFLFVGTNEPRKNLAVLTQAWQILNSHTHTLFIAGGEGTVFKKTDFSHQNYVPDEDLPALYAGATAHVIPTLYEGFGLTALEAMACGTPVIASDIPIFRELFKDEVLFSNPHDANELAIAMQKIIDHKSLADELREKGLHLAKKLSWDETAHQTQTLLESLQ